VRLAGGPRSNPHSIALDLPFVVEKVRLGNVCDGTTWTPGELDIGKGSVISFWLEGLPENADLNNVKATLGGRKLRMQYLEPPAKAGPTGLLAKVRRPPARQANAAITWEIPSGRAPFAVRVGEKIVGESHIEVKR